MRLTADLSRKYRPKVTEGILTIWDNDDNVAFECKTLELPWKKNETGISCIPDGTYEVVPRKSTKYGNHLHVTGVKDREFILIHWGNYAGSLNPKTKKVDIEGCILVGSAFADFDGDDVNEITNSKNTFNALMKAAPEGFLLNIC